MRRSKAAGGLATARKAERGGRGTARDYMLRGLVRCGICERKMQGATICAGAYYRCTARTMAPGSALLRDHPKTVNLREEPVVKALNGWIGQLFNRTNINATVAALLDSQAGQRISGGRDVAKRRLLDAESRIRRFQDAIAAGVDPAALVDPLNRAQAECAAAQAEIDNAPASTTLTDAEVYVMIDSLGDVGAALRNADPIRLHQLYRRLDLSVRQGVGKVVR
jgi:hypothetical protein